MSGRRGRRRRVAAAVLAVLGTLGGAAAATPATGAAAPAAKPENHFILGSYAYPSDTTEWATKEDDVNRRGKLLRLLAMGYNKVEAQDALKMQGWSFDNAANYLSAFSNPKRKVVPCILRNECFLKDEHMGTDAEAKAFAERKPETVEENAQRGHEERRSQLLVDNDKVRQRAAAAAARPVPGMDAATQAAQNAAISKAANNAPERRAGEGGGEGNAEGQGQGQGNKGKGKGQGKPGSFVERFARRRLRPVAAAAALVEEAEAADPKAAAAGAKDAKAAGPHEPLKLRPVVYPKKSDAELRRIAHAALLVKHQPGDPYAPNTAKQLEQTGGPGKRPEDANRGGGAVPEETEAKAETPQQAAKRKAAEEAEVKAEETNRLGSKSSDPFNVEMRRRMSADLAAKGWLSGPPGWLQDRIRAEARRAAMHQSPLLNGSPDAWPVIVPARVRADSTGRLHSVWSHPVVPQTVPLRDAVFSGPLPRVSERELGGGNLAGAAHARPVEDVTNGNGGSPGSIGNHAIPQNEI